MLNRASKKLTEKWIGPYEISSVMPNAVELKLPKTLCIHPVVNVTLGLGHSASRPKGSFVRYTGCLPRVSTP